MIDGGRPCDALYRWAEQYLGVEAQELLVSLLIEPFGPLVDDLAPGMSVDERSSARVDPSMTCAALKALIEADYAWALAEDYDHPSAQTWFWYVSAEKLEPRLGERARKDGAHLEQPLAFGRDVARVSTADLARLATSAARTAVPASDASRARGAGSGRPDDD